MSPRYSLGPSQRDLETLEPRQLFNAVIAAAPMEHVHDTAHGAISVAGHESSDPLDRFLPLGALDTDAGTQAIALRGGGQAFALSAVPVLHSNPNATQKIYLDFNGHTVANAHWDTVRNGGNPIHAPAFDLDGDIFSFSQAERDWMVEVFHRVSEDYAPFDIDVTTQSPDAAAFAAGKQAVRVVISTNTDDTRLGGTGNAWHPAAGGVAITGSWRSESDTAAFVFSNFLTQNAKNVAEAASHEAGHTLGLAHDGTEGAGRVTYYTGHGSGDISWAPIMGSSYANAVTQWSRGEYNNANNTQDDLSLIASTLNNISFRPDDYGSNLANATLITPLFGSRSIGASGIIETTQDADYFRFDTGAGMIDLAIDPAAIGANLDIKATLYTSSGQVLAQSNPLNRLDAEITANVSAGSYVLKIEGVGANNPADSGYSDYASLGRYRFVGSLPPADLPQSPAALPGDLNGDFAIGTTDLNQLLSQFGQSGPGLSGDINNDQAVDGVDLDYLFAHWGEAAIPDTAGLSRYLVPADAALGQLWTQAGFDDGAWAYAAAALGYDNDDSEFEPIIETESPSPIRSVYVRSGFEVADPAQIQTLGMALRYDDAFVAYLNGTEIARSGNTVAAPDYSSLATSSRSDSLGMRFAWFDLSDRRDLLARGANVLAVHVMNVSPTSSDILVEPEVLVTLAPPAAQNAAAVPDNEPDPGDAPQSGASPEADPPIKKIDERRQDTESASKKTRLRDQRIAASLPHLSVTVDALSFTPTKRGNATTPRHVMDLLR